MKSIINYFSRLLCALLLCAGLVMTSCESEDPIGNEGTEQNGNENNGGNENGGGESDIPANSNVCGPATFSVASITAANVTISGQLNIPEEDVPFTKVTVYFSNKDEFNISNARYTSSASFDENRKFNIALYDLKLHTKYQYCVYVKVKSEEFWSDVLDFTTADIKIELSPVQETIIGVHPEIEFNGKVSGLSEGDYSYVNIGVLISSDRNNLINEENEIEIDETQINTGGLFSVKKTDLDVPATYYYCTYVYDYYDHTYECGEILEFQTQSPYAQQDIDMNAATALNSHANCHIISFDGTYKFKAVKGQTKESVGNVSTAEILWESFGTKDPIQPLELISKVCYKDGWIAFETSGNSKKGNAVIAAKDSNGKILWSWHIWMTSKPQEVTLYNNLGKIMDRNLGATTSTPGDKRTVGLVYEWGRKDPFLNNDNIEYSDVNIEYYEGGYSATYTPHYPKSTINWPERELITEGNIMDYMCQHPTTWLIGYETDSWLTDMEYYNPCPGGWTVPNRDFWEQAVGYVCDDSNKGFDLSGKLATSDVWFPATSVGLAGEYSGFYWSASRHEGNVNKFAFDTETLWSGIFGTSCDQVAAIRCVKK